MTSASSRGARVRSSAEIWRISAILLLPVLVLMGFAAKASGTLERPAYEAPVSGR